MNVEEDKAEEATGVKNGKQRKAANKEMRAKQKAAAELKKAQDEEEALAKQAEEEAAAEAAATEAEEKAEVKAKPKSKKKKNDNGYTSLQAECLDHMKKGQKYRTRDVVLALGRKPGQKEGQPVTEALKLLAIAGRITDLTNGAGARGAYAWLMN